MQHFQRITQLLDECSEIIVIFCEKKEMYFFTWWFGGAHYLFILNLANTANEKFVIFSTENRIRHFWHDWFVTFPSRGNTWHSLHARQHLCSFCILAFPAFDRGKNVCDIYVFKTRLKVTVLYSIYGPSVLEGWLKVFVMIHTYTSTSNNIPSGHTTLKWRRINVIATWRRIDVGTTSFWYCVPASYCLDPKQTLYDLTNMFYPNKNI